MIKNFGFSISSCRPWLTDMRTLHLPIEPDFQICVFELQTQETGAVKNVLNSEVHSSFLQATSGRMDWKAVYSAVSYRRAVINFNVLWKTKKT